MDERIELICQICGSGSSSKFIPKNPYILVELLFWKHAREGKAVTDGYDEGTMPTAKDDDDVDDFAILSPISLIEDKEGEGKRREVELLSD